MQKIFSSFTVSAVHFQNRNECPTSITKGYPWIHQATEFDAM